MAQAAPQVKLYVCFPLLAPVAAEQPQQLGSQPPLSSNARGAGGSCSSTQPQALNGSLLLGTELDTPPSNRHLAALLALARLLPVALARCAAVTDILEAVDYMTGARPFHCPCCSSDEEDDEGSGAEPEPGSPCRDDSSDGGPQPPPAAQALLVAAEPTGDEAAGCESERASRPCAAAAAALQRQGQPPSGSSSEKRCSAAREAAEPPATGTTPCPSGPCKGGRDPEDSGPSTSSSRQSSPSTSRGVSLEGMYGSGGGKKLSGSSKSELGFLKGGPSAGGDSGQHAHQGGKGTASGVPTSLSPTALHRSSSDELLPSGVCGSSGAGSLDLDEQSTAKAPRPAAGRRGRQRRDDYVVGSGKRHPVWMTFEDTQLERRFLLWHSTQHLKIDRLFTVLLVAALCIGGFCQPFRLLERNPWGLLLGWCLLAPLPLALLDAQAYTARRERVVVLTRLALVAFINLISIPSYQTQVVVADGLAWGATFWLLTGAESLLVTALGLQVRWYLHLPLQFACLALAAWHLPSMCAACYPALSAGACHERSMRLLMAGGLALPSAVLRLVEAKSRS
ncbi:hypothetical protein N2152v2_010360 [Parachlorella kessleri]